ncbi:tRNA lysidine(34) synthetase TilS [Ectopseudomonas mendocina]|uniref:tRNA(Ile)-lysidine synthase n=1 Tax=Ectopseudomonas mendocina TaxID=300 RepID=A0ABZ2RKB2_ECTME
MILRARLLEHLAPWRAASAWRVAFSGGLDSTVLLHLLATLAQGERLPPISAIHIHHGLQAAADAWPAHCRAVCEALGVSLDVVYVQVKQQASIEQAARDARYRAFAETLAHNELLLTAQHRDDQAETLLFRLLRGAGVRGLSAMRPHRPLGQGYLLRPLLDVPRAELLAYAQREGLCWVEDPSNADQRYARNYLRQQVMPMLEQRWPLAASNMARAAGFLTEAGELLDELAVADLHAAQATSVFPWLTVPALSLPALRGLSESRQRNALRYWLRPLTRMPDAGHWAGWEAVRDAGPDASPLWRLDSGEVRRSHDCIWWLGGDWLKAVKRQEWSVSSAQVLDLPGNGQVVVEGELGDGNWTVGYRQAGEAMHVLGRGHRDLKRLLNEWRLPVFVRDRLPLLRKNGTVVALANRPELRSSSAQSCVIRWIPPTSDQGLS